MSNDQSNPASATPVWIAPAPAAAGQRVRNITADVGTKLATGSGTFMGLSVNTGGNASTAKVYDGINAGGLLLGTFSTAAIGSNFPAGGWPFTAGLFIVTASSNPAADVTASYFLG